MLVCFLCLTVYLDFLLLTLSIIAMHPVQGTVEFLTAVTSTAEHFCTIYWTPVSW